MAKNWKSAAFLTSNHIEHEVKGVKEKFYPVSVKMAFKIKTLAEPLANAVMAFFRSDSSQDTGTRETISPVEGTALVAHQKVTEPISLQLAQFRAAQFASAVKDLFQAGCSEDTQKVLGELVMDSMKEYFGDQKPTAEEFLAETPLDVLPDLIVGMVKANKGVFGPLALKVEKWIGEMKNGLAKTIAEKVKTRIDGAVASGESGSPARETKDEPTAMPKPAEAYPRPTSETFAS